MKHRWLTFTILALLVATTAYALDPAKEAMKPESHKSGWSAGHQSTAKADPKSCNGCHKPYFCIDCHQRRDTITERVHRRNYQFYHSVEARANPRKCDTCHTLNFCAECHQNPAREY